MNIVTINIFLLQKYNIIGRMPMIVLVQKIKYFIKNNVVWSNECVNTNV